MGPNEILAALDEAISKVQSNVLAFEKSCGDVSDQALVLQGVYKEKTGDLMDQLTNAESDVEALVSELIASAIENAESVSEEVSEEIEEMEDELQQLVGDQLDTLTEAYDNIQEGVLGFIDETVGEVDELMGDFTDLGDTYNQTLDNTLQKLGNIENQVQEHLSSFVENLTDELQSSHEDVLNDVNDFVDNALNSDLVNFFDQNEGEFADFGDDLLTNVENIGESLSNKFSELSIELLEHTDQKATEEVKEIINNMIDQIVGELAEIISETIVKSTVGVSITSATSPMMPMLVGFNKIFDALEMAIDAWKAFKETFGF